MNKKRRQQVMTDREFQEVVTARDGRCMNPHCGCPRYQFLSGHHITFKSRGGTNDPANGMTFCQFCGDAPHQGRLLDSRERLSGDQWMIAVLEWWKDKPEWIWQDAYDRLKRRQPVE